ncbi:hypothetical protein PLESTB_001593400 [Pleodorina starrii]|uniref:GS catalytic domain-containing protein n=1 Tax=Pleodorina starrii TaxID=330485 RepID=A0A9W6BZB1_9CHLO|nr:hypothetical protein PLESTM_000577600 [Pleodorina starrii]GLC60276.1 hypothetical protein PLESTB_001593400 [Pleodorina starrii]GLC66038.1 hypothetical protein PLESTF_000375000 [Pleodorina starrii]
MDRLRNLLDFATHTEHESTAPASNSSAPQSLITEAADEAGEAAATGFTMIEQAQSARPQDPSDAKAVRLLWCDTAGIRRCRVVPGRRYGGLQACGLGITTACMAMPAYGDVPAPNAGVTAVGEARMKPVETTRVALPWCPGHQIALVDFEAPRSDTPWDCCPRRALINTCDMLRDNFGLSVKVGFEVEFLLLERCPAGEGDAGLLASGWRPVDCALYCQSSAMDRQAGVLESMVESLEAMGIPVVQWHKESAPGQYEIALVYGDPVESADKLLLAKEALVGVAASRGLAVSFLPKPSPDAAGNGLHVHLSLWRDGQCVMHDPHGGAFRGTAGNHPQLEAAAAAVVAAAAAAEPDPPLATQSNPGGVRLPSLRRTTNTTPPNSDNNNNPKTKKPEHHPSKPATPSLEMLSFLAGVLSYMEVLLPFTAPSPNSYARLRPGAWAGAHAAWGYNNREVPLRLTAPGPTRLDRMHLEYKAMDGTANPHLALAAILVAGMLGLFAQLLPPEPCQVPPADLDREAATRLGVRCLPTSLRAALDALQNTLAGETFRGAMAEAISQRLLTAFLAVREAEARQAPEDAPRDMLLRYS